MKKSTLLLTVLLSVMASYAFSQEHYIVIADNGLILRDEPSAEGKKIGKLSFGAQISIIEKTDHSQTIRDEGKNISGNWVKVTFDPVTTSIAEQNFGYVFDGYLKKKSENQSELADELSQFPELANYTISSEHSPYYLKGDFFGDGINDLVLLVKDRDQTTKIIFIDYGQDTKIHILGNEDDPFNNNDYSWIGIFKRIEKGEVLWSNYEDDFIEFNDVAERDKVKLPYHAVYMHAAESCGGGFVYWHNGKFKWLQQE